ncbi:hypothetical protein MtrunA17_Chr4g0002641 [Medicago truncatula]|uniref:Uncharacterized protein n=1 Tax=Medicago truncatula TaxID=3880 RepID=A0A396HYM4_MEDTR|nr:hypothetical protein MtrunA17_Chr4g0002641 [Medicago truncatula]
MNQQNKAQLNHNQATLESFVQCDHLQEQVEIVDEKLQLDLQTQHNYYLHQAI